MNISKVFLMLLCVSVYFPSALSQTERQPTKSERASLQEDIRYRKDVSVIELRMKDGGIQKILVVGDKNSRPHLTLGATFTEAQIMWELAKAQNLVAPELQARFFMIAQRGFGSDEFLFSRPNGSQAGLRFGIHNMASDYLEVLKHVNKVSGGKKPMVSGLSLGAVVIDFAEMTQISADKQGRPVIDSSARKTIHELALGRILMGLPFALSGHTPSFIVKSSLTFSGPLMIPFMGAVKLASRMGKLLIPAYDHYVYTAVKHSPLRRLFKSISDVSYQSAESLGNTIRYGVGTNVPAELIAQYKEMFRNGDLIFELANGQRVSLAEIYLEGFENGKFLPSLFFGSQHDGIAPKSTSRMHHEQIKEKNGISTLIILDGSHGETIGGKNNLIIGMESLKFEHDLDSKRFLCSRAF